MFRNYLKVGWRNIFRNAVPSFINIFGLSLAIGIAIVGFLYLDWQYSLDGFHTKSNRVYQVVKYADLNQQFDQWGSSPIVLGPTMEQEISTVESQVRVERAGGIVRHNDNVFRQRLHFVDDSFLDLFDFETLHGSEDPLSQKTNVAISERIAEKFFGQTDPIGKEFEITVGRSEKTPFTVAAVFDNNQNRSSMVFDILVPFSNTESMGILSSDDWRVETDATFVLLQEGTDPREVVSLMDPYISIQNEANEDVQITQFRLQPLESLSVSSYLLGDPISLGNQPMGNLFLSIIGGLLLILACINYMNIAIGSASNRLKEIALRKVIGGGKGEIIKQFLLENTFVCFLALLLGVLLVKVLLLPGFNSQVPFEIPFEFSSNMMAISALTGLLLFTGLLSGAYPAFYISRFTAIDIFKGKQKFGKKGWLSRTLLAVQFVLAFWTLLSGLIFADVTFNIKSKSWGYDQNNLVVVPIKSEKHYEGLREAVSQQSGLVAMTGATHHLGINNGEATVEIDNENKRVMQFDVGDEYLESMGMQLVDGRFFSPDSESDRLESIVVNQTFARLLGSETVIGERVQKEGNWYTVVGVVEDFHYYDFYQEIMPAVFHVVDETEFNYFVTKVEATSFDQTADHIESSWTAIEPDLPYEGIKQIEVFDYFFQNMEANNRLILFYSVVALVLACMGLFGLVTFNTNKKMKEFSIHRIFGASTLRITKKITFDFFWLLIIGLAVGAPLGYISMTGLFQQIFPHGETIGLLPLIIGVFFVLITALATIFSQILKVLKRNPANVLRE